MNNVKNRDVLTASRRALATVSVDAEEKDKDGRRVVYAIGGFINLSYIFKRNRTASNKAKVKQKTTKCCAIN